MTSICENNDIYEDLRGKNGYFRATWRKSNSLKIKKLFEYLIRLMKNLRDA